MLGHGARPSPAVPGQRAGPPLAAAVVDRDRQRRRFECAGGFDLLRHETRQWPRVNLNPPAFIKSRAKVKAGIAGYQRLNALALARVTPGGLMLTS